MRDRPSVIYVAGYGRSGSTILDIVLGSHPAIWAMGAVHNLPFWGDRPCSCGEPLSSCDFWSVTLSGTDHPDGDTQLAVESRRSILRLLAGRTPSETRQRYRSDHHDVLTAARQVSGREWLVDSSKSAGQTLGRPLALRTIAGADVIVVHLVRSPLGVFRSVSAGAGGSHRPRVKRRHTIQAFHTAAQWTLTNLACLVLFRGGRTARISLDMLTGDPYEAFSRISSACGLDLSDLATTVSAEVPVKPGHQIGGNRVREQGEVVIDRSPRDERHPRDSAEWLVWGLTWPARFVVNRVGRFRL